MAESSSSSEAPEKALTLCLGGDVMTGRGIDQVLPHPCGPRLFEDFVQDAGHYLMLAERANGPISAPVAFAYPWGDAQKALAPYRPALRLVNLETAITINPKPASKAVNYRMGPGNGPVLSAFEIDACSLANNHVLDWRQRGLLETLESLQGLGIKAAGAGRDLEEAGAPVAVEPFVGCRLLFFALASPSSGVPASWSAGPGQPGVNLISEFDPGAAEELARQVKQQKSGGELVVVSIHWGGNWGHYVPPEQIAFAHELIDLGAADIVFGHSSHHAKTMEVYRGKLILYGCGDLLNDYEGIAGYEQYRGDLVLLYLPRIGLADGRLLELTLLPFQIRNFRLNSATISDVTWLGQRLTEEGRAFGTEVLPSGGHALRLSWP